VAGDRPAQGPACAIDTYLFRNQILVPVIINDLNFGPLSDVRYNYFYYRHAEEVKCRVAEIPEGARGRRLEQFRLRNYGLR
jgi:hypothetical protein